MRSEQAYFSGIFTRPPSPLSLRCICHSQEAHWACQDSLSQLEGVWVCVSLHVTSFPDQSNNISNIHVCDDDEAVGTIEKTFLDLLYSGFLNLGMTNFTH